MRTTLTLDDDVAARLERLRRARSASMKSIVNEALRIGLDRLLRPPAASAATYRVKPVALKPRVPNVDDVAEVLAIFEGETSH